MQRTDSAPQTTWTFFKGAWHEGNVPIMGVRTHAAWLGSTVFDGARAFEGVTPDLDRHLERVNRSATNFRLNAVVDTDTWMTLTREGLAKFPKDAELYIRPMYWAETGIGGGVRFDASSTNWALSIYDAPMPKGRATTLTLSPYRRPTVECAPVEAKAGCLYPNNAHAIMEAEQRGFSNCVLRDMLGNVAETANSNIFMVKDGIVSTPAANGTFLAGITRNRVIGLLRDVGVSVAERTIAYSELLSADELFTCGNFAKVAVVNRIEDRELPQGPVYERAKALYWDFAHS